MNPDETTEPTQIPVAEELNEDPVDVDGEGHPVPPLRPQVEAEQPPTLTMGDEIMSFAALLSAMKREFHVQHREGIQLIGTVLQYHLQKQSLQGSFAPPIPADFIEAAQAETPETTEDTPS